MYKDIKTGEAEGFCPSCNKNVIFQATWVDIGDKETGWCEGQLYCKECDNDYDINEIEIYFIEEK